MFKKGDYVVYKRDVCIIKEIKKNRYQNNDYYALAPIDDDSLVIDVPVDNRYNNIRGLISKKEVERIISEIPNIPLIEAHEKMMENVYRELLSSGDLLDLVRIIKTTYQRNKVRLDNNKKIGDKDNQYFEKAERYLYNEFAVVLGKNFDETKEYVVNKVIDLKK